MLFTRIATQVMNLHLSIALLVPLLLLACDKERRPQHQADDTASVQDTGPEPAPDTEPGCDTGQLEDEGECVPAACGTGTWGNLEVDESTVYVDIMAAEGGDGSEIAPFTSIQAGLDAAGDADGGMVAVAAGSYPEMLELGRGHDGVHLAGRCKELVIIDASVGDENTPGIDVDARSYEVEVSGVTVSGSHYPGVLVRSGTMTIRDSAVVESEYMGVVAYQAGIYATALAMEGCEVRGNAALGVLAYGSGTSVTLREITIEDTQPDKNGALGYGIFAYDGASLDAEVCEARRNTGVGVSAYHSGTSVTLRETIIEHTQPDRNGFGYGVEVLDGASLDAEACAVRWNTATGVDASHFGTSVTLRETTVEDNQPDKNGAFGYGIYVSDGASLDARACEVRRNTGAGVTAYDPGTSVTLRETTIEDNQPGKNGGYGYGIEVQLGASLKAEACEVGGNTAVGVAASHFGTSLTLQDTRIASTTQGEFQTVGIGVVAQNSASVVATDIEISSNEGPGLYVFNERSLLSCSNCAIRDNQFAGAVVVWDATLEIADSVIEGTTEQENIGGGVGIYAAPWSAGPPSLALTDTTTRDNPIAGVWLSGRGSYSLSGNTIHGGEGWSRKGLTKCGDAVYARDGATTWDGSSGLMLEDNEFLDGLGAGLFLDNASAALSGNSYGNNAVDLIMQGGDCEEPPDGYDDEALGSAELCPAYDYATCGDEFSLYLTLEDPESGLGAAFMRPGLLGPGEAPLPGLPVALPYIFDPLPRLPPASSLKPPEIHLEPLWHEPAPPVPFVTPKEH